MVTTSMFCQPPGATRETVWEEYRVDSTLTVMFQWKGKQLAEERIELKYANREIETKEELIGSFRDALELYKSQVFLLTEALNARQEEVDKLRGVQGSLQSDLDSTVKQLKKERAKKWIIGGTLVVGAAAILYLTK